MDKSEFNRLMTSSTCNANPLADEKCFGSHKAERGEWGEAGEWDFSGVGSGPLSGLAGASSLCLAASARVPRGGPLFSRITCPVVVTTCLL